jgi:hypothetical protein
MTACRTEHVAHGRRRRLAGAQPQVRPWIGCDRNRQIVALALNGRKFIPLACLAPGVALPPGSLLLASTVDARARTSTSSSASRPSGPSEGRRRSFANVRFWESSWNNGARAKFGRFNGGSLTLRCGRRADREPRRDRERGGGQRLRSHPGRGPEYRNVNLALLRSLAPPRRRSGAAIGASGPPRFASIASDGDRRLVQLAAKPAVGVATLSCSAWNTTSIV